MDSLLKKFLEILDIPNKMNQKLEFASVIYQKINQLLGAIDTFKGSWNVLEQTKSGYLSITVNNNR